MRPWSAKLALMCTLAIAHRVAVGAPIVVLANRDEWAGRPSTAPALRQAGARVFCGTDELQGGTWLGLNQHGLVVGLTNFTGPASDLARRSRGLLCLDMLALTSVRGVVSVASALAADSYNSFTLVVADGQQAVRVQYVRRPQIELLEPGVHVTTNWPADSAGAGKAVRVHSLVDEALNKRRSVPALLDELRAIGATHVADGDPRASVCCHLGEYGTRSSSVFAVGAALPGGVLYWHAEGAPCRHAYEDLSTQAARVLG